MYDYKIVEQISRKKKSMSGVLRKVMVLFAVIFVILGITISQSFMLAGGLTPENVAEAVSLVQPDGVDFSSGIETDGVKDYEKMKQIVTIIRGGYHG